MDIAAIIPARGGSKGVPKKNIKELNGRPLIAYVLEEAKKSKLINRILVSTDDVEIEKISKFYGVEVPCLRPKDISRDDSKTVEAIIHMLHWLKKNENYVPKYTCVLQCTSPLITSKDIDGTIEKMLKTNMDASVSICESEINPYWTNVFNGDKLEYFIKEGKNIAKRQDLPKVYRLNGAVYVVKTEVLLKEQTLEPENITGYIMDSKNSIDIDDMADFMLAEFLIKERENNA